MNKSYILIDGSYFIFFRYYAIHNWFKIAKKDVALDNPIENIDFVNKFKKTFISKIKEIPKKLNLDNPHIIVGRDCPRATIWRMKLLETYKANRVYDETFKAGPFFKLAYNEDLFTQGGSNMTISCPELEADDCIAILTKEIIKTNKKANITIITSDMDYLQLARPNVQLFDLKFKKLTERKTAYDNPDKDLFIKIVTGDKSDNIQGVFKRCGAKTACKYYDNIELFKKQLDKEEGSKERFLLNKKIIDFNEIPTHLVEKFMKMQSVL